ncbi:hypothetical protein GE21DRAFT_1083825 [Neurospora crassa]|nr:hypothetical protein GE21DRAFT_1083825 [Neurospora crassa]
MKSILPISATLAMFASLVAGARSSPVEPCRHVRNHSLPGPPGSTSWKIVPRRGQYLFPVV